MDATCLCDLGLQLNTHADLCQDVPLIVLIIVLKEEEGPGFNSRTARAYSSVASLSLAAMLAGSPAPAVLKASTSSCIFLSAALTSSIVDIVVPLHYAADT